MSSDGASPPAKARPSQRARAVRAFLHIPFVFFGVTLCAGFIIASTAQPGGVPPVFWFDIDRVALTWFNHNQCSFDGIAPLLIILDRVAIPLSVVVASPVLLLVVRGKSRMNLYASFKRQQDGLTGLKRWLAAPIATATGLLLMGGWIFYMVFHGKAVFFQDIAHAGVGQLEFCSSPVFTTSLLALMVSGGALFLSSGVMLSIVVLDNAIRRAGRLIGSILSRTTTS